MPNPMSLFGLRCPTILAALLPLPSKDSYLSGDWFVPSWIGTRLRVQTRTVRSGDRGRMCGGSLSLSPDEQGSTNKSPKKVCKERFSVEASCRWLVERIVA